MPPLSFANIYDHILALHSSFRLVLLSPHIFLPGKYFLFFSFSRAWMTLRDGTGNFVGLTYFVPYTYEKGESPVANFGELQ